MLANHPLQITIRGELGRRAARRRRIGQPLERAVRAELRRRGARALPVAPPLRGLLSAAGTLARPLRELPADLGGLWDSAQHAIRSLGRPAETQRQRVAA